ncbi:MAG: RNA polymerase sigma factor [Longimicrobiales bacterium]
MSGLESTSAALEGVIVRFGRMLRAVGLRRGLSEADLDELVQEVRVRLWRALADSEKIRRVQTSYVYSAAMSAALDMLRRRRARPEEAVDVALLDDEVAEASTPETDLERGELAARIDRAIRELPEARAVVVRLHLSGYDRLEIARLLGWTEPKVRNLIYRGLADLRVLLRPEVTGPRRVV